MTETDPVLFEILRHRMWTINDEAAATIGVVSGSPVATEAFDFNTGLMDADGNVVMIGNYVMAHAAALDAFVAHVVEEYSDNPGIGEGDMFITNDPYLGAMHQPDVVLIAPIYHEGKRIMWCGSIVHQSDVGGPLAGSVTTGATSIFGEAIPVAPMKIVEGGQLRKDLEREYLIRSRMPGLNALDLRAQIAANRVQITRILELCEQYGVETIKAASANVVDSTAARLQDRVSELPQGRWRSTVLLEHDGIEDKVYDVALTMTNDRKLVFDFSASSPQAPSLINCAMGTLRGYVLAAVLTQLAYDLPWCPAAVLRTIEIRARPGTVVNAEWPAGVSMGNTASGHAARTAANICIASMLDGSDDYADKVIASCGGTFAGQTISGLKEGGTRFGTMLIDSLAVGMGARSFGDGADTGGVVNAPRAAIANVETNELNYPMLYLWRRQTPDSGGPGRFRGGVGAEHAYVPHRAPDGIESTLFAAGVEQSTSLGVAGGEPGGVNGFVHAKGVTDVTVRQEGDLGAERAALPPKGTLHIRNADGFVHVYGGGGGFGDPLDRNPEAVQLDVERRLVTIVGARRDYFVALKVDGELGFAVDEHETERLRADERRRRLAGREPKPRRADDGGAEAKRLSSHLTRAGDAVSCRHCGELLAAAGEELKTGLEVDEVPAPEEWPRSAAVSGSGRFVLRRYFCPGCATQLEAEVAEAGKMPLRTLELLG